MPVMSGALLMAGSMASSAYAANKAQETAQEQMAFQAGMSNTSYQRGVVDMRAAGINPILAAQRGGASTPAGAQPSQFFDAGPAINSALTARFQGEQIKMLRQQTRTEEQRTRTEESNADVADFERRVVDALRHNYRDSGVDAEARRRLAEAQAGSTAAGLERSIDESSGEFLRYLRRLGVSGSTAASIYGSATRPSPIINRVPRR